VKGYLTLVEYKINKGVEFVMTGLGSS